MTDGINTVRSSILTDGIYAVRLAILTDGITTVRFFNFDGRHLCCPFGNTDGWYNYHPFFNFDGRHKCRPYNI